MENLNPSPYLRFIQQTGFTKHVDGFFATDLLFKKAKLKKNMVVLDVGCGAGHSSAHVAKHFGLKVVGLDISHDALEKAKELYRYEDFFHRLSFIKGDARVLPFADDSFDALLCESVLLFISDKEKALKEMHRVLKPGGLLMLNELVMAPGASQAQNFFSQEEFGAHLENALVYRNFFSRHGFFIMLEDESPLAIKKQAMNELRQAFSPKYFWLLLEFAHKVINDSQMRQDIFHILKFSLNMPKDLLKGLNRLLVLAKKI